MKKRLSRHTVVVLLVALGVCLGGMSLAVGAFGQSGGDPDATVPLGDYTQTTPATSTQPLSSYTSTSPTTTPSTTPSTAPTDTGEGLPATTNGSKPETTNGSKPETTHGRRDVALPSKATRSGPTHLAFTGGEPIVVGAAGAGLMLAGLALHRRRRQRPAA